MVNQALESEPLAESISGESQPQQRQSGLRLRRTRKRPSPNIDSSTSHRKAISHNRPSPSIKSEASGPHQRASRKKRPPKMPASDVSSIMSPKYTKTGRISKAKKGVKGAHICGCGKVCFPLISSVFPLSSSSRISFGVVQKSLQPTVKISVSQIFLRFFLPLSS